MGQRTGFASRSVRLLLIITMTGSCLLLAAPSAQAQRGRRPTAAQRAAMQKAREQMQAYQKDVLRYQNEMAAKQAEIVRKFDANGDGQLRGPEKSKFDKHMYEIQTGRQPNPFVGILPPGQGAEMKAATK